MYVPYVSMYIQGERFIPSTAYIYTVLNKQPDELSRVFFSRSCLVICRKRRYRTTIAHHIAVLQTDRLKFNPVRKAFVFDEIFSHYFVWSFVQVKGTNSEQIVQLGPL